MFTIFDLKHNLDQDDLELGLRVACALYLENGNQDGFLKILPLRHSWAIKGIRHGSVGLVKELDMGNS